MEVLQIVPATRYKGKLNAQNTSEMIKASTQKPHDRVRSIEDGIKDTLRYSSNEYLNAFGISVEEEMMTLQARILPSPNVEFDNRKTLQGGSGSWNLKGIRFIDAPLLDSCAFIFFSRVQIGQAEEIRTAVLDRWANYGINISRDVISRTPVIITNPSIHLNIRGGIQAAIRDAMREFKGIKPKIIVCLLPKLDKPLYQAIKQVALCEAGIVTQCMQIKHVANPGFIKEQYIGNVALKVNIKLGGTNNIVSEQLCKKLTMYVGIDVTHPAPGKHLILV
jgi:eukaryotic translation initiation factor 2C